MDNGDVKQTTVVNLLLTYLKQEGVRCIFGMPGNTMMPFYEALCQFDGITPVIARHELGAAFMADGYARANGTLGVCCAISGPGATNLMTGVACSYTDSIPLLVITGQIPVTLFDKGVPHDSSYYGVDVVEMFKSVCKRSEMLIHPANAANMFRSAIRTALSGRKGPVHINIPVDLMKETVPLDVPAPNNYRAQPLLPGGDAISEALRLLQGPGKIAALAGNGVNLANAGNELIQLAEHLDMPVAVTVQGKGAFPGSHGLSLGVLGFCGSLTAKKYLLSGEIDVLLVIGTRMGQASTFDWDKRLRPSRALIQIDVDAAAIGKNYPVDVGIVSDARAALRALLKRLTQEPAPTHRGSEAFIKKLRQAGPLYIDAHKMDSNAVPIKPQRVMKELRAVFPDDGLLFVDIGACMTWAIHYFPVYQPGTFFINFSCASMGHAAAACIGAKLACPGKPVAALLGDGGFAMTGFEVHCAVEQGAPVTWIVLNNGGYGMIRQTEHARFDGRFRTSLFSHRIDAAAIARGMGADSLAIIDPGDLRPALETAVNCNRPMVVDIAVDMDEPPPVGPGDS
jgi:acetolactate synthase-1/2/3 large subunit